jgi:PAS domain S-box-containing protein
MQVEARVPESLSGNQQASDITGALQSMERRLESLFGMNPDALFTLDTEGRLLYGNAALEMMMAASVREFVGRSLLDFVAEEDRERAWRYFARALGGDSQRFEVAAEAADGRELALEVTLAPTLNGGAAEGVHGMARDVTRAVEAERALRDVQERYALLAENVQDMISLHDTDGTFLYASPSAVSVLGYHPVEIVGRTVYDLVEPEDVAMLRAAHAAIMKREGRGPALFRARHRDGSQRWMETAARMVEHPETGEPWRIVGATRDISERRSFERHLMQSQKMEALGRLAGGIAHDFNNALTVIGGHADLLMTQLGDAPTRKQAEYIREAALRASALTSQLQSFGRSARRKCASSTPMR